MVADPVPVDHPVVAGLAAAVGELVERLGGLEAELAALREENADLRRQLGRHSGNSGQPPSQGRKPGGQPGHPGRTRMQVDEEQILACPGPARAAAVRDGARGACDALPRLRKMMARNSARLETIMAL